MATHSSIQYSYLDNSMGRRASWATVHRVAKSRTQLSTHAHKVKLSADFSSYLLNPLLSDPPNVRRTPGFSFLTSFSIYTLFQCFL